MGVPIGADRDPAPTKFMSLFQCVIQFLGGVPFPCRFTVGISRDTVSEYMRRADVVGIRWPVPPEMYDTALERKRFIPPFAINSSSTPTGSER